ncbi:hypothetical protein EKK58_12185 [Candidatus Dependentiae bacterium]|nr:MAG: hypothetical protein EKK58_12185 [Candidatus Dependentiae bacterium]
MIARTKDIKPQAKRRAPQRFEVRVVVEIQMPPWLQALQASGSGFSARPVVSASISEGSSESTRAQCHLAEVTSADPLQGELQEVGTVPNQDVNGSAFLFTSTESRPEIISTISADHLAESPAASSPESLLSAYVSQMQPKRERSAGTKAIAEHLSSCRLFDAFLAERIHLRSHTPMVDLLKTSDLLQSYAAWLIVEKDRSRVTAGKRIDHVMMVAREVFQTKLERPSEKELKRLEDSKQKAESDGRRIPSFGEIDALATAVSVARFPYGKHAPYFWRGLIRAAAFLGFRTYDFVSLIPEKTGLRKQDIVWESLCPVADVNNALGYELHSEFGWLHYEINKDTGSDCRKVLFPMPKWLRDWLRFFFELSGHKERIFPSMKQLALDSKAFGVNWKRIVSAAGVDPRIRLSEGSGDVIALRKYAANWWTLATLRAKTDAALADKLGHYLLHHAEVTTAQKHYISTQAAVLPVMLELMASWPVPAADAAHVSLLPE